MDGSPYPRWFTIPARASLFALEIGSAVYVGLYHQSMVNRGYRSQAQTAICGVSNPLSSVYTPSLLLAVTRYRSRYVMQFFRL